VLPRHLGEQHRHDDCRRFHQRHRGGHMPAIRDAAPVEKLHRRDESDRADRTIGCGNRRRIEAIQKSAQ